MSNSRIDSGVAVAVIVTAVIFICLCIFWTASKTNRIKFFRKLRHSNGIRLPPSSDCAEETAIVGHGETYGSNSGAFPGAARHLSPRLCPTSPTHSISVYSRPPPPPNAYMSGSGPLFSPPFMPVWSANPPPEASDCTSDNYRSVQAASQLYNARIPLPVTQLVSPTDNFGIEEAAVEDAISLPEVRRSRAPRPSPLHIKTDIQDIINLKAQTEITIMNAEIDVEQSVSYSTIQNKMISSSSHPLRYDSGSCSSLYESILLSLSSSSLNPEHDSWATAEVARTTLQIPSPPPTPNCSVIAAAAVPLPPSHGPVIITNVNRKTDDDESWCDVLSFADYEREERPIRLKTFGSGNQIPSPPPTPTLLFTPPSPPPRSSTAVSGDGWTDIDNAAQSFWGSTYCGIGNIKGTGINSNGLICRPGIDGGHSPLLLHPHSIGSASHNRGRNIKPSEAGETYTMDELPSYQSLGFDYKTRLALKRATSSSSSPIKSVVHRTNIPFKQFTSLIKPRPPLIEFEPLLLRTVDRTRINTHDPAPQFAAATETKLPTPNLSPRGRTRPGVKNEVPPHVLVLELLIEQASRQRPGSVVTGMI